jgi:ADP-ribose pyrophosphatase YjhB (NUDIX family)
MKEIHVARVAIRSPNRSKILLLRRAAHNVTGVGLWECPGGKSSSGSYVDLCKTVDEEVLEETGLKRVIIRKEEKFLEVDRNLVTEGVYAGTTFITHFIIGLNESKDPLVLDRDHDYGDWVSYEEALEYDLTPQTEKGLIAFRDRLKTPFG